MGSDSILNFSVRGQLFFLNTVFMKIIDKGQNQARRNFRSSFAKEGLLPSRDICKYLKWEPAEMV